MEKINQLANNIKNSFGLKIASMALLTTLSTQAIDAQQKKTDSKVPQTESFSNIEIQKNYQGIVKLFHDKHIKTTEDKEELNKAIKIYLNKGYFSCMDTLATAIYDDKNLNDNQKFAVMVSLLSRETKRAKSLDAILDTESGGDAYEDYGSSLEYLEKDSKKALKKDKKIHTSTDELKLWATAYESLIN